RHRDNDEHDFEEHFFFSSRRRHTRSKRDWSSDVCSSDLSAFQFEYIDMDQEQTEEKHQQMIAQMEEEDYLYPLVLLNGEIVAEGIPQLKPIYRAVEEADPSLV